MQPHGLAECQASLSFTVSQSLPKLMSFELVIPSNHLILCHPLLLPSVFPSIRVFSKELALCIRCPKYWSISLSPSSEYSGLISFRIDWFDFLVNRDSQESSPAPQFKSINFSVLSLLDGPTHIRTWLLGKPYLSIWTFVGKVMSLLFNTLSRFCHSLSSKKQAV